MKGKGYLVLYNNFNHSIYAVCCGTYEAGYNYLMGLRSFYGREIEDDGEVYFFETKDKALDFIADGMGVLNYSTPEEYRKRQLEMAETYFDNLVYV